MKHLDFRQFVDRYPDDDICLDMIFRTRFGNPTICPKCGYTTTFYRISTRKSYECGKCHYHLYPLVGTIMQGSTTSLRTWFYAIYLFSISKNGISANELCRFLGVTFKTAWRIGHKIRTAMKNNDLKLSGIIEADEALLGGKAHGKRGWGAANKVCLLGLVEKHGNIKVVHIEHRNRDSIFPIIISTVEKGTFIHTDEFKAYLTLPNHGYGHSYVTHSHYQWRSGDVHTNSIEGYWSNLKKSIRGTFTFVSKQHLQKYLDEFNFRYNHRKNLNLFDEILKNVVNHGNNKQSAIRPE
jgi:transposase